MVGSTALPDTFATKHRDVLCPGPDKKFSVEPSSVLYASHPHVPLCSPQLLTPHSHAPWDCGHGGERRGDEHNTPVNHLHTEKINARQALV